MATLRSQQIDLQRTPYYHVVSRCVRRAFLCGLDTLTGKNYDHRKRWLVDRFKFLSSLFAIDLAAYCVLANHYHLVIRVDRDRAQEWSDNEVLRRWALVSTQSLAARYIAKEVLTADEVQSLAASVPIYRARLYDVSWYMRYLNEGIARSANYEDQCTGRFWQGRYKCQALLDEAALLAVMAYVDLNPIRAKIATTLEMSDFTSIQERLAREAKRRLRQKSSRARTTRINEPPTVPRALLLPFLADANPKDPTAPTAGGNHTHHLPCTFAAYVELVEWTGRSIRKNKRGVIPPSVANTLEQLAVDPAYWVKTVKAFHRCYANAAGPVTRLQGWAEKLHQLRVRGIRHAMQLYRVATS